MNLFEKSSPNKHLHSISHVSINEQDHNFHRKLSVQRFIPGSPDFTYDEEDFSPIVARRFTKKISKQPLNVKTPHIPKYDEV